MDTAYSILKSRSFLIIIFGHRSPTPNAQNESCLFSLRAELVIRSLSANISRLKNLEYV